jgi:ABC-type dipeptide/oligopeptide/nickel transport system permease subunit
MAATGVAVRELVFPRPRSRATWVMTAVTVGYAVLYGIAAAIELAAWNSEQEIDAILLPILTVGLGLPASLLGLLVTQDFGTVRYTIVMVLLVWLQAYGFWRLFVGVVLSSTPEDAPNG